MSKPKWKRVLLKISGEALAGDKSSNVDPEIVMRIAREVAAIARLGVEVSTTESTMYDGGVAVSQCLLKWGLSTTWPRVC